MSFEALKRIGTRPKLADSNAAGAGYEAVTVVEERAWDDESDPESEEEPEPEVLMEFTSTGMPVGNFKKSKPSLVKEYKRCTLSQGAETFAVVTDYKAVSVRWKRKSVGLIGPKDVYNPMHSPEEALSTYGAVKPN